MLKIAIWGLGAMGAAIAERLRQAPDYEVLGFDIEPANIRDALAIGVIHGSFENSVCAAISSWSDSGRSARFARGWRSRSLKRRSAPRRLLLRSGLPPRSRLFRLLLCCAICSRSSTFYLFINPGNNLIQTGLLVACCQVAN